MFGIVADLGREDYNRVLKVQRKLAELKNENQVPDVLMFLEHYDVYTAGIHRNPHEVVLPDTPVVNVERGGALTYHGPGQLVVYFILNMNSRKTNIRDIIIKIQNSIISVLEEYSIPSDGRLEKHTGVWAGERKICSIGFAIRGSSTLHGIALNVSTDLSKFSAIMPCGFDAEIMTSMEKELGYAPDFNEVREKLKKSILKNLDFDKIKEIRDLDDLATFEGSVGNSL